MFEKQVKVMLHFMNCTSMPLEQCQQVATAKFFFLHRSQKLCVVDYMKVRLVTGLAVASKFMTHSAKQRNAKKKSTIP